MAMLNYQAGFFTSMAQNMSELLTLYPMYRLIDVFLMVCHAKNHCYHPAKTPV